MEAEINTYTLTPWPVGSNDLNENGCRMLIEGDGVYACEGKSLWLQTITDLH